MAGHKPIEMTDETQAWPGYRPPYDAETESQQKTRLHEMGLWEEFWFCLQRLRRKGGVGNSWKKAQHYIREETKFYPPPAAPDGTGESTVLAPRVEQSVALPPTVPPTPAVGSDPFPWAGLPERADPAEEARWVHRNYRQVVHRPVGGGPVVLRWKRALCPPPSDGAAGLMEWAAENRTSFYKDVWLRLNVKDDPEKDDDLKAERKSIEEIKAILEKLKESNK